MLCQGKWILRVRPHQRLQTHQIRTELVRPPLQIHQTPTGLVIYCVYKVHSDVSTIHVYSHACPDSKVHAHEQVFSTPWDMIPASSPNTLVCCSASFMHAHLLSILTLSELPFHLQTPARAIPAANETLLPSQSSSEGTLSEQSCPRPQPWNKCICFGLLFSPSHSPYHTVMEEPM